MLLPKKDLVKSFKEILSLSGMDVFEHVEHFSSCSASYI